MDLGRMLLIGCALLPGFCAAVFRHVMTLTARRVPRPLNRRNARLEYKKGC
jgi:hypothetical protein